jgi:O-6-methylguanine DNA methyltransferase
METILSSGPERPDGRSFVQWGSFESPEGAWRLALTERGVCRLALPGEEAEAFHRWLARWCPIAAVIEDPAAVRAAAEAVLARAAGRFDAPEPPLDLRGTSFRVTVWETIRRIPPGATATYGEIARLVGRPEAPRAVGAAVAANPVPILVPTHRIVAADGSSPGYGVEVAWKLRLLSAERGHAPKPAEVGR